jgi:hypothetical protein
MDMSALQSLTPEERAALKAALDTPEDPMAKLASAVQMLSEELSAVKEAHEALKCLVMDDLIGGIKEAYDGNERLGRMEAFKGKYGATLDPLAEPFKKTFARDLHDDAFKYYDGLSGEDGFSDEVGDGKIKEIVAQIKERLGIKDEPSAIVAEVKEEKPADTGKAEEEPDEMQSMYDEIDKMKRRDASRAEARKAEPARKRA